MTVHGVMITNGPGGHPSWKHAKMTASLLIVDPDPENDPDGGKRNAAEELRHKVEQILEQHHENVKQHEVAQLKGKGNARHNDPLEPEAQHLDAAVKSIVDLTKGTVLEAHYSREDVQGALRHVLAREFRTQQHIHRSEHKAKA